MVLIDFQSRALWHYYFENNDGLVFVVDTSDRERFSEAREELQSMLSDDRLRHSAVLVLANKQDMPGAATPAQIVEAMGMDKTGGTRTHVSHLLWFFILFRILLCPARRRWHVQGCCAHTGDGLVEGFSWLADNVRKIRKERRGLGNSTF